MMLAGVVYPVTPWAPLTSDDESGLPDSDEIESKEGTHQVRFRRGARYWPTITSNDAKNTAGKEQFNRNSLPLNAEVCVNDLGQLIPQCLGRPVNPRWGEWLMGWPDMWTDLQPLATAKYREWWQQHGNI
jgi:hypothetical protein